jgi:hypothetical protein
MRWGGSAETISPCPISVSLKIALPAPGSKRLAGDAHSDHAAEIVEERRVPARQQIALQPAPMGCERIEIGCGKIDIIALERRIEAGAEPLDGTPEQHGAKHQPHPGPDRARAGGQPIARTGFRFERRGEG